jgi:hypothetical protein
MTTDVICLDVLSNTEVWLKSSRICSRSPAPQRSAGRALKALKVPGDATIHFRRFGCVVRAVLLSKLWEDTP